LIEQLRHRNWILCDRGADTYGFVHRTFLEYFCAMEIVHRFEKARTLTFEQLRDEVFGAHWQDETWHEVLKLICGSIDPYLAGELVDSLIVIKQNYGPDDFDLVYYDGHISFVSDDYAHIFLAAECLLEVKDRLKITRIDKKLLAIVKDLVEYCAPTTPWGWAIGGAINHANLMLKVRRQAVKSIAKTWQNEKETFLWLRNLAQSGYPCDEGEAQSEAIQELVRGWKDQTPLVLDILYACVLNTPLQHNNHVVESPCQTALSLLLKHYPTHSKTLELLHDRALNDPDDQLRTWAQEQLKLLEANP
jgi:hypothetical protein